MAALLEFDIARVIGANDIDMRSLNCIHSIEFGSVLRIEWPIATIIRSPVKTMPLISKLVAFAATVFIAVAVWRVGSMWLFNDRSGQGIPPASFDDHRAKPSTEDRSEKATVVQQERDGRFQLSASTATLHSPSLRLETKADESAIVGWDTPRDTCSWNVELMRSGDGYFRARVRYRCGQTVRFELTNGDQQLAVWTLAKSDDISVEEKFVRLAKPGRYELTAKPLGSATTLKLYHIELAPR